MKARLIIHDSGVKELHLELSDNSNVLDVLRTQPDIFRRVYHPLEKRFYKQVAIQVSSKEQPFIDVRNSMENPLPQEVTIILAPTGTCTSDWEPII